MSIFARSDDLHASLLTNFDHHTVPISSMEKLPVELLSRIMVYVVCRTDTESGQCCPNYITDDFEDYAEFWLPVKNTNPQTFGPLQLGLVSRFWRSVSENTPYLWNRIAVGIDNTDALNISKTMRDLSTRLSRSKASLLDVLVIYRGTHSSMYETLNRHTIMVLDELHNHSSRFFSISLQLSFGFWAPLEYYRKSSPRLTHFRLVNDGSAMEYQSHDVKTLWPSLTHLTLELMHFGNVSIGIASLTCLRLISVRIPIPWKAIENAHRLMYLTMDNCSIPHTNSLVDQSTVTLPNMKHFEYNPGFRSGSVNLMKMFIFPALEIFTLQDDTYEPGCCIDELRSHSFLSASANSLRRIALIETKRNRRPPPDCNGLIDIFSSLISLEYLELGLTEMPHSYFYPLLARLTAVEGVGDVTFLPKLRSLKFNSLPGLFWPAIPGIFHRTGSLNQRPLQQLIVKNVLAVKAESLTIDIIDDLIGLLEDGIDIQFYDEDGEWISLKDSARR